MTKIKTPVYSKLNLIGGTTTITFSKKGDMKNYLKFEGEFFRSKTPLVATKNHRIVSSKNPEIITGFWGRSGNIYFAVIF